MCKIWNPQIKENTLNPLNVKAILVHWDEKQAFAGSKKPLVCLAKHSQ
jgi:hypothetical protein